MKRANYYQARTMEDNLVTKLAKLINDNNLFMNVSVVKYYHSKVTALLMQ